MPTGTPGDDLFTASTGNQNFDGGDGIDTVSYVNSGTGVYVNLQTGESTPLLKVMPFGDSITYGVISAGTVIDEDSGGYRTYLWNALQAEDLAIDYVGSIQSGPLDFSDRDNEGLRGRTIGYLNTVDEGFLKTYKPDVVLLMIGTNNTSGLTADQMISQLRSLIISIATNDPTATIFVAQIPPAWDAHKNEVAEQYNAMIPGLIQELDDTYKVIFVSTSDLTLADVSAPPGDTGVHPTAEGYQKIADDWFNAIMSSGVFMDERDTLSSIENVTGSNYGDKLVGNGSANVLSGLAGNDQLIGAGGNDTLNGGAGNDVMDGGSGVDKMVGGAGSDTYVVDNSKDVIVEGGGAGIDSVQSSVTFTLPAGVEKLTLTGTAAIDGTGNGLNNTITGNDGPNDLYGRGGNDTLVGGNGDDHLYGGDGKDVIRGGAGMDILSGGSGNDRFDWNSVDETQIGAARDQLIDFTHSQDQLDVSSIDAKSGTTANDAFAFIGGSAFSGVAGQLRAELVLDAGGDYTIVQGDINGDGVADFEIALVGYTASLQGSDFIL